MGLCKRDCRYATYHGSSVALVLFACFVMLLASFMAVNTILRPQHGLVTTKRVGTISGLRNRLPVNRMSTAFWQFQSSLDQCSRSSDLSGFASTGVVTMSSRNPVVGDEAYCWPTSSSVTIWQALRMVSLVTSGSAVTVMTILSILAPDTIGSICLEGTKAKLADQPSSPSDIPSVALAQAQVDIMTLKLDRKKA